MAHNYWRFFDNPLVGSWRHLPDDLSLQRDCDPARRAPDPRPCNVEAKRAGPRRPSQRKRRGRYPEEPARIAAGQEREKSSGPATHGAQTRGRSSGPASSRRRPYRRGHAAGAAARWRSSAQLSLLEHQRAILLEHILFCSQKHFVIRRKRLEGSPGVGKAV